MKKTAIKIFEDAGGQLRMQEAISRGMSRYMLYSLHKSGIIVQVSRGVYRLSDMPPLSNPDLVIVSIRIPQAVICLVSALSFHELTTQIPHSVDIALPPCSRIPSLGKPPVSAHRFSGESYSAGIEERLVDEKVVRIYSSEKTLADCFKFRNKLGMDTVLEALKLYKNRKRIQVGKLIKYAKICRVEKVMNPYLEAIL